MQMLIGGEEVSASSGETIEVLNPALGKTFDTIPKGDASDVQTAAETAEASLSEWEKVSASERAKIFIRAGDLIRKNADELSTLLTTEQGKPIREAKDEILGTAHVFEYYASMAGSLQGDAAFLPKYGYMNVIRKPIGVCGSIIPWNMPAIIFGWKIGAALISGNAVVAKPSVTAPLTVLSLAKILIKAGIPNGSLNIVTGFGETLGNAVVQNEKIRHISFTGSVSSGKHVAASAAPHLKRLTLELGGNDAFIVCKDADIPKTAKMAVRNRFYNCGQVCTSAKRIIVDESVADEFTRHVSFEMEKIILGNGLLGSTMGPLNNSQQRDAVSLAVENIVSSESGTMHLGGEKISGPGFFYAPTLLTNVAPDSVSEEIFGPVLPIIPFSNIDEAIDTANATHYGLGASVWTKNLETAFFITRSLNAGVVWINKHLTLPPEIPFGGVKDSGYGRENGREFIYEYTKAKSILLSL